MNFEVLYSAAHAEFPDTEPLGGGKAVADYLIREWRNERPFPLTVLSPKSVWMKDYAIPSPQRGEGQGEGANETPVRTSPSPEPSPFKGEGKKLRKSLIEMTELEYARFCRQFERAATAEILKHDPRHCVVLSNDISEGPDFAVLGERGYRVVPIFHVDVVEYFTKFYLRGVMKPETAARFRWFSLLPDMLRLVFQKQYECVRHSARIVVPSAPMRETILRCYPWCTAEKIAVLPWGDMSVTPHPDPLPATRGEGTPQVSPLPSARGEDQGEGLNIARNEFVILTLSRLSPEKGIERLLAALPRVHVRGHKLRVLICGGAAYMKGRAYERKLRRLVARITSLRVEFTGHVSGDIKARLLQRADLLVSPSLHESYGLTIAEAMAAGCRVISHHHYGASGQVVDCSNPAALASAISTVVAGGRTRRTGAPPPPTRAAAQLAELLKSVAEYRTDAFKL